MKYSQAALETIYHLHYTYAYRHNHNLGMCRDYLAKHVKMARSTKRNEQAAGKGYIAGLLSNVDRATLK